MLFIRQALNLNLFLLLFLVIKHTNEKKNHVSEFISDLLKYSRKFSSPYKLVAYFCWSERDTINFMKKMFKENIMVSVFSANQNWSLCVYKDYEEFLMFVLDLTCENSEQLIIQANFSKLLNPPNRWVLLWNINKQHSFNNQHLIKTNLFMYRKINLNSMQDYMTNNLLYLLNRLDVHTRTEVMIGIQSYNGNFLLVDVYKRNRTVDVDLNIVASWNKYTGITWLSDTVVANRRRNLQGIPMRVVTVILNNNTLEHLTDLVNIHIDTVTRVTNFLVIHANEQMNTSIQMIYVQSWGYFVNGTWDGMMGYLLRDEADIAGTAMILVPHRTPLVQYLTMIVPSRLGFVFREPPLSYTSNIFTLPFSRGVWISIVVLLGICGVFLYFTFKWENFVQNGLESCHDDNTRDGPVRHGVSWSDTVMFVMECITEQGSTLEPNKISGRIVSIFLLIFVIFIITSYSASIVVILQSSSDSIQTLQDLLDSRLELASHDTVYHRHFIKSVNDSLRRAIYEKKLAPKGSKEKFISLSEGIERMRTGRFAFHFELGVGFKLMSDTYLEHEKCGLKIITYLPVVNTYQVIQKHSPYKDIILIAYRKMLERGILRRAYNRYYTKAPECATKDSSFVEVGLTEFLPALMLISYGVLCSFIVFLFEILMYKWSAMKKQTLQAKENSQIWSQIT